VFVRTWLRAWHGFDVHIFTSNARLSHELGLSPDALCKLKLFIFLIL
jgi:hypothetical protein